MSNNTKSDEQLVALQNVEKIIARGLVAFDERNDLIYEMTSQGYRQADITRALNAVRSKIGAPEITPDAVAATIKRVERKRAGA